MAREAQIHINVESGAIKVTDEEGNRAKRLSKKQVNRFRRNFGRYLGTATIFQRKGSLCIIIVIGGTVYEICL
jgi:hypothetical protein